MGHVILGTLQDILSSYDLMYVCKLHLPALFPRRFINDEGAEQRWFRNPIFCCSVCV